MNPRQVEMKHEAGEQTDYRCRDDFLQKLGPQWSGRGRQNDSTGDRNGGSKSFGISFFAPNNRMVNTW